MQLDLFARHVAHTAQLHAFPSDRLVGKARRTASAYSRCKTDRAKESYWQRTAATMAKQLRRHGFSPETIDRELERFARAVSRELDILDKRARGA